MSNINVVRTIELVEVSKIKPYKNNARVNDHVVPALIKSIERFGFNQPVVLDKNYEIVCGHTRIKAAIALKMKEVPCVFANDLTQDEINAYRLADNKVAEQALWDYAKLEEELTNIGSKIAMTDFGFDSTSLSKIEGFFEETTEEQKPEEPNNEEGSGTCVCTKTTHTCPYCGEEFED